MLATRVIPIICYDGRQCVKPQGYGRRGPRRVIGPLAVVARVYGRRNADEIVLLDINARAEGRPPNLGALRLLAEALPGCPITYGGGIRGVADIREVLRSGADKAAVGAAVWGDREGGALHEAASRVGRQALVALVDAVRRPDGSWGIYRPGALHGDPDFALPTPDEVGEVILTAVDREGTLGGYDLDLLRAAAGILTIPIVAHGGAGHPEHCVAAIQAGADAVAAGSMFHFTQHIPADVRVALHEAGCTVRG